MPRIVLEPIRLGMIASLVGTLLSPPSAAQSYQTDVVVSADTFEHVLSPHGDWYDTDQYGRVWVPHVSVVGEGFVPYSSAGHWEATDHGWLFVSHYSWGWIPFHYGNWFFDPDLGWAWVPGEEWAPSWVHWRTGRVRPGEEYIGWMPIPPAGYDVPESWVFVHTRDFCRPRLWRHIVPRPRFSIALRATAPLRDIVRVRRRRWYRGPDIDHVRRVSVAPVRRLHIAPPERNTIVRIERRGGRTVLRHSRDPVVIKRRRARVHRRIDTRPNRRWKNADPSRSRKRGVRRPNYGTAAGPGHATIDRRRSRRKVDADPAKRKRRPVVTTARRRSRRRPVHGSAGPAQPSAARSRGVRSARDSDDQKRRSNKGSVSTSSRRKQSTTSSTSSSKRRRGSGGNKPVIRRRAPKAK